MRFRTLFMGLLLTLLAAGVARANSGVFPVRGTNLSEGEQRAIGSLIASAYAFGTGKPVLGPDELAQVLAQTQSERDAALQLGLEEYISVEAIRLNSRIALSVRLRNKYGSDLYRLNTTAMSLDDMEVVAERIATTLQRRTPLKYTRTIDNVTGKEASPNARNRAFIEKIFGVRTAGILPFGSHVGGHAGMSLMFDGRLESDEHFFEFGAGFMLPSQSLDSGAGITALVVQMGANYYLTHSSVSPYVGVGLSPRLVVGEYSGVGFAANAQLGLMFMRESSTRLYVELRLDQNLLPLKYRADGAAQDVSYADYAEGARTKSALPTELSLAAGIGW